MKVIIAEDYTKQCSIAADIFEEIIRAKPDCCLGLATGSSPVGMYQELARRCRAEGLDFSRVHSVNLDEYVGLEPTHDQSYRYFMDTNLFDHINIDKRNTYVAKGTGDVEANLREFNDVLASSEIDIQLLGVGGDGHIGFNEPETPYNTYTHSVLLTDKTKQMNAELFSGTENVPDNAVTMGLKTICDAKNVILVAFGSEKAEIIHQLVYGKTSTYVPAAMLQMHMNMTLLLDEEAAEKIK